VERGAFLNFYALPCTFMRILEVTFARSTIDESGRGAFTVDLDRRLASNREAATVWHV